MEHFLMPRDLVMGETRLFGFFPPTALQYFLNIKENEENVLRVMFKLNKNGSLKN